MKLKKKSESPQSNRRVFDRLASNPSIIGQRKASPAATKNWRNLGPPQGVRHEFSRQ
jgi:hypothetical protein